MINQFSSGRKQTGNTSGLLSRLARNRAGNTTIIMAAAIIPLTGLLGSGFDIGRAYLVKSRLQTSCDSGVLAGRRSIVGTAWNTAAKSVADQYFDANFQSGRYGAFNQAHNFTSADGITVSGTASASVPTTLMKIFGRTQTDVAVTCKAVMNLPNTDVMFVLDTTGSMAQVNPTDTVDRITALKSAVTNFHTSLEAAKSAGTQVRYGFVPYSTNVNVGMLLKRDWMVDKWTYQSREPDGTSSSSSTSTMVLAESESDWNTITGSGAWVPSNLPLESCFKPADTVVWGATTNIANTLKYFDKNGTEITKSEYDTQASDDTTRLGLKTTEVLEYTASGKRYSISRTATSCTLYTQDLTNFREQYLKTKTWQMSSGGTSTSYNWRYRPIEYNVAMLKGSAPNGLMAGGSVPATIGENHTNVSVPWIGCVEERDTNRFSGTTIPANTYDLDIDLVPNGNKATQWRPHLPGLVFRRNAWGWQAADWINSAYVDSHELWEGGAWAVCPAPAAKLSSLTSGQLSSYLSTLVPAGDTVHDQGMLWGLRLLSPTGLFASENATTPSGAQITRHIVFMTDGETSVDPADYTAYGLEALDQRKTTAGVIPDRTALISASEDRLLALCNRAKARNTTVWVIAFGTSLTSLLTDCASTGSAFQANNATQLNTAFTEIASKIANLRLAE